jgi:hemerythrin
MASRTKVSEMPVGLGVLDEEHSEIQRKYLRLDRAILETSSLQSRIAAELLAEAILQDLVHEEEFLRKTSFPFLQEHCDSQMKMMSEIFKIELDLSRNDISASLRLRDLCREWMHERVAVGNKKGDRGTGPRQSAGFH